MKESLFHCVKPYGYLNIKVIHLVFQWKGRYFIKDNSSNIFETNEETYIRLKEELK